MPMRRLAEERSKLFDQQAERYDRCRPTYPGAVIDEILIPEPVRHLLTRKGFVFADRGEFVPKGFEDAVRLFEVRWREYE